jgi:hypothetical protein
MITIVIRSLNYPVPFLNIFFILGGTEWLLEDVIHAQQFLHLDNTRHIASTADVQQSSCSCCLHHSEVHVDWLSCEDGSHLLTAVIGSTLLIYTSSTDSASWQMICKTQLTDSSDVDQQIISHVTWIRNGILTVCNTHEITLFSQWNKMRNLPANLPMKSISAVSCMLQL